MDDDFLFEHFGKPEFPGQEDFQPKKTTGKFEKPIEGKIPDNVFQNYLIDVNLLSQDEFMKKYCR